LILGHGAPLWQGWKSRALMPVVQEALGRAGYRLVPSGGRAATILPDDRLIVSYPRSGNTWLSFLLTNLTHPNEPTTFLNLDLRCPDIYQRSNQYLLHMPRPRLMKSHEPFDGRYRRVVYLVRDPCDVALSYHRFLAKTRAIDESLPLSQFVDGFLAGRWNSERGSWGEHVGSWLGARRSDDSFLLLRYEDLHGQPEQRLAEVADFLEISHSQESCARAVTLATPQRMRELEAAEADRVPELKGTRREIPFVGAAEVGAGRIELEAADQARILDRWRTVIDGLGYAPGRS
jgi:estrone sulfotransferase